MKQKLNNYLKLIFFFFLFGFLIWGLIHLLLNFSIQTNGFITFLSVIIPHGVALTYIGYNVVVLILKIKNLKTSARVVIVDPKK